MSRTVVFIGTYTQPILFGTGEVLRGHGDGIYVYTLENGELKPHGSARTTNASFLVKDPVNSCVYATNEVKELPGQAGGSVSAFRLDRQTLSLTALNSQPVHGADPCHVETDGQGRFLYCANFMSGSITVLPLQADGSLKPDSCFIQHAGSSIDSARQRGPHAHGVFFSPNGRFLFVPDLGLDVVKCYRPDYTTGTLTPIAENDLPSPAPGAGPRHLVFRPNGRHCYLNTEMGSNVSACSYDAATGHITVLQTLSTLPAGTAPKSSSTAAIKLHPNGRLLYVSNRGHDSLATYRVDDQTGLLELLAVQKTGGSIPRDFEFSPDGRALVAAHQSSDSAVVFDVNTENGRITERSRITVPTPICVRIYSVD